MEMYLLPRTNPPSRSPRSPPAQSLTLFGRALQIGKSAISQTQLLDDGTQQPSCRVTPHCNFIIFIHKYSGYKKVYKTPVKMSGIYHAVNKYWFKPLN